MTCVALLGVVTVAEVTIVSTYVMLCYEVGYSFYPSSYSNRSANALPELPLVVAFVLDWCRFCLVDFCLLYLFLLCQAPHSRICVGLALLQLQLSGVSALRTFDGLCRVRHCVYFCSKNV